VTAATCGVMVTWGCFHSNESTGSGSVENTSKMAALIHFSLTIYSDCYILYRHIYCHTNNLCISKLAST